MIHKIEEYKKILIQEYKDGDIFFFIGLVANILLFISLTLTLYHVIKLNSTFGYPLNIIIIKIVTAFLWIIYGLGRGSEMIILRSVILLFYFFFFIYMKVIKGV